MGIKTKKKHYVKLFIIIQIVFYPTPFMYVGNYASDFFFPDVKKKV